MRRNYVTAMSQITRRAPEAGRIKIGVKKPTSSGKIRPASIDTFRFTSPHEGAIRQLAALYGGTAGKWSDPKASPKNQWQVVSEASDIRVMLVPDGLSTQYELWAGSGRQRLCDGEVVEMPVVIGDDYEMQEQPCICNAKGARECKPKTRLQVVLPEIDFIGTWRFESGGWDALAELPGMFDLIAGLTQTGRLVEARFAIRKVERMTPMGPRQFVVPHLYMATSLDGLAAGQTGAPALAGPDLAALPPAPAPITDDVIDAELVDDEILDLEDKLRADARNFGLDEQAYVDAVRRMCRSDPNRDERQRLRECIDRVRAGTLEPTGFGANGVTWYQP